MFIPCTGHTLAVLPTTEKLDSGYQCSATFFTSEILNHDKISSKHLTLPLSTTDSSRHF